MTLFLGRGGLVVSLALFALANTLFRAGLVFSDALLPVVSTERTPGRVSGSGLGWGRPAAVLTLVAVVGLAYAVLASVDDAPRAWAPADFVPEAAPA